MFDLNILEKQLEDATSGKNFGQPTFNERAFNKNKYASNNKNKN